MLGNINDQNRQGLWPHGADIVVAETKDRQNRYVILGSDKKKKMLDTGYVL